MAFGVPASVRLQRVGSAMKSWRPRQHDGVANRFHTYLQSEDDNSIDAGQAMEPEKVVEEVAEMLEVSQRTKLKRKSPSGGGCSETRARRDRGTSYTIRLAIAAMDERNS